MAHVKPAALFSFTSHKSCSSCTRLICADPTLRAFLCNATHELKGLDEGLRATEVGHDVGHLLGGGEELVNVDAEVLRHLPET